MQYGGRYHQYLRYVDLLVTSPVLTLALLLVLFFVVLVLFFFSAVNESSRQFDSLWSRNIHQLKSNVCTHISCFFSSCQSNFTRNYAPGSITIFLPVYYERPMMFCFCVCTLPSVQYEVVPPITVKGKSEPLPVFRPVKSLLPAGTGGASGGSAGLSSSSNLKAASVGYSLSGLGTKSMLWDKIQKKIIKHKNIFGRKIQLSKINKLLNEGRAVIILEGRTSHYF